MPCLLFPSLHCLFPFTIAFPCYISCNIVSLPQRSPCIALPFLHFLHCYCSLLSSLHYFFIPALLSAPSLHRAANYSFPRPAPFPAATSLYPTVRSHVHCFILSSFPCASCIIVSQGRLPLFHYSSLKTTHHPGRFCIPKLPYTVPAFLHQTFLLFQASCTLTASSPRPPSAPHRSCCPGIIDCLLVAAW